MGELRSTLSPTEFVHWIAFLNREPRGEKRIDINFGWVIYNMRKMMGDKVEFKDCVLTFDGKKETSTEATKTPELKKLADSFRIYTNAHKGKAKAKKTK